MNSRQIGLYNNLIALTAKNEAFYFEDFDIGNSKFRIFNYRFASYSDFISSPDGLECRGHTFLIDSNGNPLELVVWPPEKFFNYMENPLTTNIDLSTIEEVYEKLDGSLISSFLFDDELFLKSKGSFYSEQAKDAMKWLKQHHSFYQSVRSITADGYTVNFEWCSPKNRVVVNYYEPTLKVISVRSRSNGEYIDYKFYKDLFGENNVVSCINVDDRNAFIKNVPELTDNIEGFVVKLISGLRFKIKTKKYMSLHRAKDIINNPYNLFEVILDENVDDLRSLFHSDPIALTKIDQKQQQVNHIFNSMVKHVEEFYQKNKDLNRKDYAIKAQKHVNPMYFSLAMKKYLGKDPEYKSFLKNKWKEFDLFEY